MSEQALSFMSRWLPRAGWMSITAQHALSLGLPVRSTWQVWRIEWLRFGVTFCARRLP